MIKKQLKRQLIKSDYVRYPMEVDLSTGAQARWNNKKVLNSLVIFNPEKNILEKTEKNECEIVQSDFVCPSTRHKSLMMVADGSKVKGLYPCLFSVVLKLDGLDLSKYNRISMYVYVKAEGYRNMFWNISLGDEVDGFVKHDYPHDPSVETNKWVKINWELGKISRSNIKRMSISPFVGGNLPESLPEVTIYFNDIICERVTPDYEEGWDLNNRIAYAHSGYFKDFKKIALIQNAKSDIFNLYNAEKEIVYTNTARKVETNFGTYYELDFSSFNLEGEYVLTIDDRKTKPFLIDENPYESSIWKSISFLKSLQCGVDVVGVHSACHLNSFTIHPDSRTVPNFGGWHDAGDLSQFEICTAEIAHSILDLCEYVNNNKLSKRLLEEAKVGLEWLLRTRFGDGYRSLAVLYGVWNTNISTDVDKAKTTNKAENGPFENLLASASEARGYHLFLKNDPVFAKWCLRSAIEDYQFGVDGYYQGIYTKRWGASIDSQVGGIAITAAVELYKITGDDKYYQDAKKFAKIVMSCQETEYLNWEKPLRGFFYEDPKHEFILYYEHRGHEQTPIQGIVNLCLEFPEDPDFESWITCVNLYKEFVNQTLEYTKPYTLVPNQLFILGKINKERVTVPSYYGTLEKGLENLDNQIKSGIKLNEGVYLRIFPAAVQRRGYHATLLSKAKAISQIALLLDDHEFMQVALDQIEWVMGKNPFSSSAMYGEGHNYHPLYVAYSNQMVGALPVGIKTYDNNDIPYWPVINNSVFKEVWGHTTAKYLWVLADIFKIKNKI